VPCIRCEGTGVNDSFYERIDEQGIAVGKLRKNSVVRLNYPVCTSGITGVHNAGCFLRPDNHEGGRHALSRKSSCDVEDQ
jgi:hypothetical protein